MIRYLFLILTFALEQGFIKAQEIPSIATDRPDQTECPFIVPVGYFQAENGFFYEKTSPKSQSIAYPSVLWKYGCSNRLELRLITEWVSEQAFSQTKIGLAPVTIGFKVSIAEEKGVLPKTAFIGHLTVPTLGSNPFKLPYYATAFRFTMQHTLSDRFTFAYNLGAEWDGETPPPTFIYTVTTGFSISKKVGSYLELYGFSPQNQRSDHRLDGGFTYLINDNVMLDASGGLGLTSNAPKYFGALGFSYRFKTKKIKKWW
jgi:Putative MetA-pathway of phenol degradation